MDSRKFDALVRSLGVAAPRRVVLNVVAAAVGGGLALQSRARTDARSFPPFTCAGGAHPCKAGNTTACCQPGEHCCNRKTGNPICLPSKKDCPA